MCVRAKRGPEVSSCTHRKNSFREKNERFVVAHIHALLSDNGNIYLFSVFKYAVIACKTIDNNYING